MTDTQTNRSAIANVQQQPRQELVAHQNSEITPVSLPEVAERIATAVQGMGADLVYVDVTTTRNAEGSTTKLSFRAFKSKPQKGVFD